MPPKRSKGVTFKLVHQSYDDAEPGAVLVEERALRRHQPQGAAPRRCPSPQADVGEWAREWDTPAAPSSARTGTVRLPGEDAYMNKRNMLRAQDSDDDAHSHEKHVDGDSDDNNNSNGDYDNDERLFEDQEEGEITDDFLRELVFGDGDEEGDEVDTLDGGIEGAKQSDEAMYMQHDVTKRGVDRQFTQMMREFNVDACLNEAYTDDPRTHGALEVKYYLRALEEFVVGKAGVDYDTAEPLRNKGLIHQLKGMTLGAGTDMGSGGELHTTTLLPDKQARFVAEFQRVKEEIQRAARQRMEERRSGSHTKETEREDGETSANEGNTEEDMYVVREVRDRAHQLDCETAISAHSTYFNQPNVIRAPLTGKQRRRRGGAASSSAQQRGGPLRGEEEEEADAAPGPCTQLFTYARCKGETKEEKKLRQQLVREAQRERRVKKRELKQAYKVLEADEIKRSKESQTSKRTVRLF